MIELGIRSNFDLFWSDFSHFLCLLWKVEETCDRRWKESKVMGKYSLFIRCWSCFRISYDSFRNGQIKNADPKSRQSNERWIFWGHSLWLSKHFPWSLPSLQEIGIFSTIQRGWTSCIFYNTSIRYINVPNRTFPGYSHPEQSCLTIFMIFQD